MATAEAAKKEREADLTAEQKKEQREQLAAGKKGPSGAKLKTVVAQRTGDPNAKPVNGIVDNMTRRDGAEPLQGHFVLIDYAGNKGVAEDVQRQLGNDDVEPGPGVADYGVYTQPGELGDDGYPVTAVVFLRDEHAAQVVVPYKALKRALAGGRR